MTDEKAFLRAIATARSDDAPRLVYADWLLERGDADRAEYLRLICSRDESAIGDRLREVAQSLDPAWMAQVHFDYPIAHPSYAIVRRVARGAMTTVYEAVTTPPNHRGLRVAVCVLNRPRDVSPFRSACQAGARVQEEHIPRLYEVGEFRGQPYSVRMFIDGDDLCNNLRGAKLAPPIILQAITAAASALDAIHRQGFVHGCVHPRHLLRSNDGSVWLIGLGETLSAESPIGNPLHLAPEQFEGPIGPAGSLVDVYQLAETAAWLLTRWHPFQTYLGPERLLAAKRSANGWRTDAMRDLPHRAIAVLGRAMSPDPAARYQTAGEFAVALADGFGQRPRWRPW
jgi:uncharacterized protein (TIGR02996 family)